MKEKTMEIIRSEARFYLNTPEKAAEALLFVRNLERFAEELKAKIKERAVELMERDKIDLISYSTTDQETGEIREWEVKRDYGKQSKEYRPENVLDALGPVGLQFMKVGKKALDEFLKKSSAKGEISMETVSKATADPMIKMVKGSGVRIVELKPKK